MRTGRCAPQARSRDVAMKGKFQWKKKGPEDENMASPVPTSEEEMRSRKHFAKANLPQQRA